MKKFTIFGRYTYAVLDWVNKSWLEAGNKWTHIGIGQDEEAQRMQICETTKEGN
jgi:hypothetical protein